LLYADRHYDLNTPESTTDGALDWMGLAHALALPGCVHMLTDAFGPRPLLEALTVVIAPACIKVTASYPPGGPCRR
jgi:arginase